VLDLAIVEACSSSHLRPALTRDRVQRKARLGEISPIGPIHRGAYAFRALLLKGKIQASTIARVWLDSSCKLTPRCICDERRHSSTKRRIDGRGASDLFGARRPLTKFHRWRTTGPFQSLAMREIACQTHTVFLMRKAVLSRARGRKRSRLCRGRGQWARQHGAHFKREIVQRVRLG
jgi:hypothetical protein